MRLFTFFVCLLLSLTGFAQNNPPVAVNDTIYVGFNDSLFFQAQNNSFPDLLYSNDSDPNSNNIFIDTAFYTGQALFYFTKVSTTLNLGSVRFTYKPPLNYIGIDSAKYILKDNGAPVMYDTATVYFFVKHSEYEQIDLNNIRANVSLRRLFSSGFSTHGFEVPKGSNLNTIFAANLWLGGKNQNNLHLNADTYGPGNTFNPQTSFVSRSGPIMTPNFYEMYSYKWDRFWKVTNIEIQYHINNWNNSGYQPIEVIKNWPAHGDVGKGQATNLAPFVDSNSDGIYNPLDGDYPKIKGQQAIYYIYNDHNNYSQTGGNTMGSEVHYMAYAYSCASDSAINNTIFLDYTIYNRSNLTYDSTYVGMWTDMDIGDAPDDRIGCDVNRSSFYGYSQIDTSQLSYKNHPPAQGVVFLKGAKQDNDGIDNNFGIAANETINGLGFGDGIADNEYWGMEYFKPYSIGATSQGDPNSSSSFYYYLTNKWLDASLMVYGGTGHYSSGGTVPAKFMFPDSSDSYFYGTNGLAQPSWSEISAGTFSGDRRAVGSTGPFTFEPDSSVSITLAFVFGRDYQTTGSFAGIEVMKERIDSIRSYYLTDFTSVCGGTLSVAEEVEQNNIKIFPNPFNNQFTINYELENNTAQIAVYSVVGEKIKTQTINQNSTVVDLNNQPNGFYFITITDGNKKISQKIVKQ